MKSVIGIYLCNLQGNQEYIFASVIESNIKLWFLAFQSEFRTMNRLFFNALNIHFDVCNHFIGIKTVNTNSFYLNAFFGNS